MAIMTTLTPGPPRRSPAPTPPAEATELESTSRAALAAGKRAPGCSRTVGHSSSKTGDYAVSTSIEATGSALNASRFAAYARTRVSISAVDRLPTRSQTTFGGLP
jgi:hypothetical protein